MSVFNKFKKKNLWNSSMVVTCVASGKCEFRHTTMCDRCKNNMGMEKTESYFEPRESL